MSEISPDLVADATIITDLDASLRLVEKYGDQIRYSPGVGWLSWEGRRWEQGDRRLLAYSRSTARARTIETLEVGNRDLVGRALTLEGASHIAGAVKLAESDLRIVVDPAKLDADPWLLNVENGMLNLRTGELLPHTKSVMMTKLAPVAYDATAVHPALTKYLADLDAGMPGMSDFLARCLGMALTGDASAEVLHLLQGDGGGGKTTLTDPFGAMLGDYAVKLPFTSFMLSKHGRSPGAASPDLVVLRGARFAFAAEGDASAKIDAGIVKNLTGGEAVTARGLYSAPITFPQTWKLWFVSNYDPKCDADDSGLWRRLVKVTFPAIPAEKRDPAVKAALMSDPLARSALLAWSVRGCRAWLAAGGGRQGLAIPAAVDAWTAAYRDKQDSLNAWWRDALNEDFRLTRGGLTAVATLRQHYEDWAHEQGLPPVLGRRFNEYLEARGLVRAQARMTPSYSYTNTKTNTKVWRGLAEGRLERETDETDVTDLPKTSPIARTGEVCGEAVTPVTPPLIEGDEGGCL